MQLLHSAIIASAMNYPEAELRGIKIIPVKMGIQKTNELDSRCESSRESLRPAQKTAGMTAKGKDY